MIPAEVARQVRRIRFATGRHVADLLSGAYLSVFRGRGMEFDEVRPYVPGDDVRTIDWNVTARTGEPFVKRFMEERELTVMLLVDVSASQDFGSGRRSKREAAAELAAVVAFSATQNGDKVGLLLFGAQTESWVPPRKGQKHALRVIREVLQDGAQPRAPERRRPVRALLESLARLARVRRAEQTTGAAGRGTSIRAALEHLRRALPRRAVVFLVSDFLDEGYLPALRAATKRHDVVAVEVSDLRERELVPAGLLRLEDAETGELRLVDTASAAFRAAAASAASARSARLESELRASRVDLVQIEAGESVVAPLLAFFRARERRHRR
ncbi:MAG: DUF58 domain-containing protein [Myxococcales bacterium]|nr:DUF58 domain-containing protein [Myxococcales bacterium]